jgi:hypothetical protein
MAVREVGPVPGGGPRRRRRRRAVAHAALLQRAEARLEGHHRALDLAADLEQRLADHEALDQHTGRLVGHAVVVDPNGRERAGAAQQPFDVGPPVLGGVEPGVLLAQQHELGAQRDERLARHRSGEVEPAAPEPPWTLVAVDLDGHRISPSARGRPAPATPSAAAPARSP